MRASHHGEADVSERLLCHSLVVDGAVCVVVVEVLDGLSAASGGAEFDGIGEAGGDGAGLLGDLVSLLASGAGGVAVKLEGHGGGGRAASGDLVGAGLVVRFTASVTLVVHEELLVGVGAVVGGVSAVLGEDAHIVAETGGGSGGAEGLHGGAVTEGRGVAGVFGDLGDSAAVLATLVIGAFDHGDITGSVDDNGGSDDEEGSEESEDLGHFWFFFKRGFLFENFGR